MKIYVDFDDCLCETALEFTHIADRLFGKKIPYDKVMFFDLQKSFDLSGEEYRLLMEEGHRPEVLLSYEETPGASKVLNEWIDKGHEISIITGRPYSCYDVSRRWLDEHGLDRVTLYCLDKYGRDPFNREADNNLELEDYYKMHFDIAVEDSPHAFRFFEHLPELKVLVYERPWNKDCNLPGAGYVRCPDWNRIRELVN